LKDDLVRTPIRRRIRVASAVAMLMLALAMASIAAAQGPATFSGSVMDQIGRLLPNTTLVLSALDGTRKYEIHSDQIGQFEIQGVPAGDYRLETRVLGFAVDQGRFLLAPGANVHDLALQIGSLEETITVTSGDPAPPQIVSYVPRQKWSSECSQSGAAGCIDPPRLLTRVAPGFPVSRSRTDAQSSATVVVEARIGIDGFMKDLRVLAPADQEFVKPTFDALRQWRYTTTRLDGVPVEANVRVTVNFATAQ